MVVGQLNKILILFLLIIFSNQNLFAVEFIGKFNQGSFILGKTNPGAKVKIDNKDILGLSEAYKEIFATKNFTENISKLNGASKENPLVKNVIEFITKDKKRSICTPFS